MMIILYPCFTGNTSGRGGPESDTPSSASRRSEKKNVVKVHSRPWLKEITLDYGYRVILTRRKTFTPISYDHDTLETTVRMRLFLKRPYLTDLPHAVQAISDLPSDEKRPFENLPANWLVRQESSESIILEAYTQGQLQNINGFLRSVVSRLN